jgi:putative peptidoglycan lipid II flippase
MAVGTTLSRLTGVIRVFAIAFALGSFALADSYNLANTIPNIVHDIVLGGIVSATFIPVFVERLATRTDEEAWEAISAVTSVTLVVIAVATILFYALTPAIIDTVTALNNAPNAAQTRHVATDLLVLFVPQLACYGLISLSTALLNARHSFAAPMFAPIANNVVLIVVLITFRIVVRQPTLAGVAAHRGQLLLLGLGTTLGVVAQAWIMIPSLRRAGLRLKWKLDFRHEAVRTILSLSSWTFGLVVANQVALFVVLAMSQKVGHGAVSAYTYAYTFFQLPYGVVAVSIMAATAPMLTSLWSAGNLEGFRRRMALSLRSMLAMIVPAAAGLVVLARPIAALFLAHGATSVPATVPTGTALAMLALGLPGFCVFLYAIRVLQSIQDLPSAFALYVLENAINIVLAVSLSGPLGVRGIALSISVAYTLAAVPAMLRVRQRVHGLGAQFILRPLGRVVVSCVPLVVAAALASNVIASERTLALLLRVVLGVGAGALAYFVCAGALAAVAARTGGQRGPRGSDGPDGPDGGPPSNFGSPVGAPEHGPARAPRPGDDASGDDESGDESGDSSRESRRARQKAWTALRARLHWPWPRKGIEAPAPPERLPPAGQPPARPGKLGPTRRPEPGSPVRGKLGR